jgi:hypothetical protein
MFMRRLTRPPRIAALCVLSSTAKPHQNLERIALLSELARILRKAPDWHSLDAIVLPGGFFRMKRAFGASTFAQRRASVSSEQFAPSAQKIVSQLQHGNPGIRLVFGVLASSSDPTERTEQSSLAFSRSGLVAVARKIFPTARDTRGKRYITPFIPDYSSPHRLLRLANGSTAALNSCYDLLGIADIGSGAVARRLAIRRLLLGRGCHITQGDEEFAAARRRCLMAWHQFVEAHQPDVALATIHRFRLPGQDSFWQRHGIAGASASLGGALVVAAAHFESALPQPNMSTLFFAIVWPMHAARIKSDAGLISGCLMRVNI